MYIVCVSIHIKPEFLDAFMQATKANHEGTRQEPGNLRFDVLQAEEDPTRFFLYEVYKTPEDFPKHHATAHYQKWRETIAPWMAEPRVGVKHRNIFPTDENWTK